MALELRIAGPGFDALHLLQPGEPELVIGRDADCGVCLPDPQRNLSRRHLAVWNLADELHFHVLSVVNGVDMPFGEAPPGARGVLVTGQTLKLAGYSLTLAVVRSPAPQDSADPWAVFDTDATAAGVAAVAQQAPEDDPFGDWEFDATFGPAAGLNAATLGAATDLAPFFRGLGVEAVRKGQASAGELESMGRLARTALLGLLALRAVSAGVKQELHAEDRTMVAVRDRNPLTSEWSDQTKLLYLFGPQTSAAGMSRPDKALDALVNELLTHELAAAAAARAAVEGTLRDFAPGALKSRLLGDGSRLFEGARAWDAYAKHYAEQGADMPRWAQRLLDKYFAEAYLRESQRLQRDADAAPATRAGRGDS